MYGAGDISCTHTHKASVPALDAKSTLSTSCLVSVDTICVPIHNILTVVSDCDPCRFRGLYHLRNASPRVYISSFNGKFLE